MHKASSAVPPRRVDAKAPSSAGSKLSSASSPSASNPAEARRRLSVIRAPGQADVNSIDGVADPSSAASAAAASDVKLAARGAPKGCFKRYVAKSKVGYMQFNPSKVNQDRAMEVPKVGGRDDRAFFGVFDGHGVNGHQVSEFIIQNMPKFLVGQKQLEEETTEALIDTFALTSQALIKSPIDCTFSGSTGVAVLINRKQIICANVGDSRAVLGQVDARGKCKALPLSDDHKPDRPDEMARIVNNGGRVEACQGPSGPIGPARVWLLNDDVPGLAMSRSFGDLIAASVGVTPEPEILEHDMQPNDRFIVLGSDGIWEFITSQEAIDMVVESKNINEACERLVDEATRRWRQEEDVIDDITCIVIELNGDDDDASVPAVAAGVSRIGASPNLSAASPNLSASSPSSGSFAPPPLSISPAAPASRLAPMAVPSPSASMSSATAKKFSNTPSAAASSASRPAASRFGK